ncbi:hypothetical protein B0T26DRAFT_764398 [Lasiosphaeria miniovina]|uniref:Protein kinase domain-containing protein n=1 Tax=Lasiosphaeria miniovina TaxID=1954250 RepID=A0AA40B3H6_9PEZI|nr:uncharacterized protein B0T26DRAFT_764398 [Lasiosphaeria miniovina]KAK0726961.1 hypothetical protein B0T26DRAFT_764398 [Lasiosphaeria miniovina]
MSYTNGSGGTLTLPSPTHAHRVDVSSAVRSLRRSLSRSPSKFRLSGTTSPTPEPSVGYHASTPSFSGQFGITHIHQTSTTPTGPTPQPPFLTPQPAALATPFKSNAKLSMRPARSKAVTGRPLSRTRVSPKSPLKRVFGPSHDSGNPIRSSVSGPEARGQENPSFAEFALTLSPASRRNLEKPSRHSMHLDVSGSSKHGLTKFFGSNADLFSSTSVSPLKRSDATMSLDQTDPGSPVAKRRSLHGVSSLGSEFSIFDYRPPVMQQGCDIHDETNHEYQLTGSCVPTQFREPLASPTPSAVPKRTSSLRKSTLQQRHGDSRTSWGRRAGEKQLAQISSEPAATPAARSSRPRLSLDQYLPPDERGSPFTSQSPLPNPSIHPVQRNSGHPHPLSRTMTQSSSGSSLPDDSPTHVPIHVGEKPRVLLNFSKSLPPGAPRPINDSEPVATPQYKRAKPFQAAFMSTGLISKMNRNPELGPPQKPGVKVAMPDTPCKKQPYNSATYPPQFGSGRRGSRPSFGSPSTPFGSTPFGPPSGPIRGNPFGVQDKPSGLFFQVSSGHNRKSSLLGLDGDDQTELPGQCDDFPPTPTKNLFFKSFSTPAQGTQTPAVSRAYPRTTSISGLGNEQPVPNSSCKSQTPHETPRDSGQKQNDRPLEAVVRPSTPNPRGSPRLSLSLSSLGGYRARQKLFATPVPPTKSTPSVYVVDNQARLYEVAQTDPAAIASPLNLEDFAVASSPQTPQDSMAPPDASRLAISNSRDGASRSVRPPATPTTHSRQVMEVPNRRMSITPQNGHGPKDIDESLVRRFDTSEVIGKGEFSQVYRVVKSTIPMSLFVDTPSKRTPSTPDYEAVYAVKKVRLPAHGAKERESKLHEVAILKALGNSMHIVHYMDSWEMNGYLYIQTEYCTEGSLDGFLKAAGQAGRLDDFRIWKILFEIDQARFIHLDIKPANILVNFDGYLKIADFGMAAQWPAPMGIDGEGDREYIGPEILRGRFDKPADVFALGLIILEIACNVYLPDNGPTWQALRNADMSMVPTLTCGKASAIVRDANGVPIEHDSNNANAQEGGTPKPKTGLGAYGRRRGFPFEAMTHDPSNLFGPQKRSELLDPPTFMTDPADANSLDSIVKWMIQPNPADRPTSQKLLMSAPVCWVSSRRAAGATVYEGNWGPQPGPSAEELVDTEMTDV